MKLFRRSERAGMPLHEHKSRLALEFLEDRTLLSAFSQSLALPGYILYHAAGTTTISSTQPVGYTPAQIYHAYAFDQITLPGGMKADGSNTTIAIVDAYDDPEIADDLHRFDLQFDLPDPTFSKVNQAGGARLPAANAAWAGEIALDVEWAHAIAPAARLLLVETNDSSFPSLLAGVRYAAEQPSVVAVSMSWASGEFSDETSDDSAFVTPGGHSGVTFVAAAGDTGAPASYPAVSPNVLAVGGTSLNLDGQGHYRGETAWSHGGGGISSFEPQPFYQQGVITQSSTFRTSPDVAYDGDPSAGFPVYNSYDNGSAAPWSEMGGTSAAAPQWAALIAIADQGRLLTGQDSLDGPSQTLPALYQFSTTDFHDITSGSSIGSLQLFAGPGYDLVTGRGTPIANRLVTDLLAVPSVTHFAISTPARAAAGASFSVTVTALDRNDDVSAGYTGTVHFASSDGTAILPADYTFTAADHGVHTFTGLLFGRAGSQAITAQDTSSVGILGSATLNITGVSQGRFAFSQRGTGDSRSPGVPGSRSKSAPSQSAAQAAAFLAFSPSQTSPPTTQALSPASTTETDALLPVAAGARPSPAATPDSGSSGDDAGSDDEILSRKPDVRPANASLSSSPIPPIVAPEAEQTGAQQGGERPAIEAYFAAPLQLQGLERAALAASGCILPREVQELSSAAPAALLLMLVFLERHEHAVARRLAHHPIDFRE
jgi:hypothetical protein